jgi:hypothetical protein
VIAALDDLTVRPGQPDDAGISRMGRARVEAGLRHMQANRLKISARGAASAQAEIEDKLINR